MARREFLFGCAVVACPPTAALAADKIHRVAIFATRPPVSDIAGTDPVDPAFTAFANAMRDLGYIRGQNLVLERWAQDQLARYSEVARDLVRRKFDVIVTVGNEMVQEIKRVTSTVPIVMATSYDPVQAGIVASLARPGGNVTGFTSDAGGDLEVKRLQLLKEALPEATRIAYLGFKGEWEGAEGQGLRAAAATLGVTLAHAEQTATHYFDAFAVIARERPHALFVATNPMNYANRQVIADFAAEQRLPGSYPFRAIAEAGGLMSYGANTEDLFRRAAGYVDKILKGVRPSDLPVQQPTKFELVINLKTARALGINIAPTVLVLADEVIE